MPPELSIYNWKAIVSLMISMDYALIDLHEHEFSKEGLSAEFGVINTLPEFAGVKLEDLELHQDGDAAYYLLNPEQYLRVYAASSKDRYRADRNNNKDAEKIAFLERLILS
ncbi:phosphoribosylanthranilate isomerase [Metabacillus sp. 84]|uniref:phosphoribosylanthranilate isomerase n=1 Tax=Metabacillus sp. 84 TaxID=3404705 RepID=UPI003CEDE878